MCKFGKTWELMQLLVCLMLVALAPLAQASILINGQTAPPDTLTPGGTILATTSGTITTPTFIVFFTSTVHSDPANAFCSGCLDFVYQYFNHGPDVNERSSAANFGASWWMLVITRLPRVKFRPLWIAL